jgi:mannosyltransferase
LAAILSGRVDSRERRAILAALTMGVATLAVAWLVSQVSPAWTTRYLGVALGPIILLASLGLARAGNLGLVAVAIVLGIWGTTTLTTRRIGLENKSNISDLAGAVSTQLRPGDLVISLQPEQTPLINYHLPPGLQYATEIGTVHRPAVMDWRDAQDKLEDATPARNLDPLLAKLPRSGRVLLVHPVTARLTDWDAPWTQLIRRRSAQWGLALEQDPRFKRVGAVPSFYRRAGRIGVRGVLYEKSS